MTSAKPDGPEYFLIPRDDDGTYITTAETILSEKGIDSFVQEVRPPTQGLSADEELLVAELRTLLPAQINLPADNPFLTLRVSPPQEAFNEALDGCACKCGAAYACSGGGSGSPHVVEQ